MKLNLLAYWCCSSEFLVAWRMDYLVQPLEVGWFLRALTWQRAKLLKVSFSKSQNITARVKMVMVRTASRFYRSKRTFCHPSNAIGIDMHSFVIQELLSYVSQVL